MSWESFNRIAAKYRHEGILIATAIIAFVLVWPVGEYGILDDWAFVKSLEHLHVSGKLVVLDWNPMSLTGHLFWGLAFTKLLGFSFLATKISVFVAGVLVSLIVYWYARRHGANPQLAFVAGMGLLLNPLFFVHIFMYMTDVTGLFWQWLSIWCLSIGLARNDRWKSSLLAAGSVFWAMAFLTRQHGITVPLALGAYILLFDRSLFRWRILAPAYLPGVWVTVNGLYWHAVVQPNNRSFQASSELVRQFLLDPPWANLPYILFSFAVYVGLFVAPVALAVRWKGLFNLTRISQILVFVACWLGISYWTHASMRGWYFPYCRNVVTPSGFFEPFAFAVWAMPQLWEREWGIAVGLLGVIAALVWILCLGSWVSEPRTTDGPTDRRGFAVRLVLLLLVFQLGYCFATAPILFDRHLLLLAPSAIVLAALMVQADNSPRWSVSLLILGGYACYAVPCAHDIHAVSRAVFLEGVRLHATGVPVDKIDAGYAFDGWFMYEKSFAISPPSPVILPPWWPEPVKVYGSDVEHPWWVYELVTAIEPEYVVTASTPVPAFMYRGKYRYEEVPTERTYQTYWPWAEHKVQVFRCIPAISSVPEKPRG